MDKSRQIVFNEFLRLNECQPIAVRVRNYRALAELLGDIPEATDLRVQARELEVADHRCREFAFRFANPQP
jgi:hypothetical protein